MRSAEQCCFYIQSKIQIHRKSTEKKRHSLLFSKLPCPPFRKFYFPVYFALLPDYRLNMKWSCHLSVPVVQSVVRTGQRSSKQSIIMSHYPCCSAAYSYLPKSRLKIVVFQGKKKKLENLFVNVTQRNLHQLSICNGEKKRYLNLTVGPARCLES